jgi:hypothetical protein
MRSGKPSAITLRGVHAGVDADHVEQVSRAHGPAELFHDLVDGLEVGTVTHQHVETAEVREQHAVDQEARAVVDHDRGLAHLLGVATVVATAASEDFSPRITSTSGIMCTGLKKCMPTKFSGRFSQAWPAKVMEMVEVLEARIASSATRPSTSPARRP